MAAVFALIAVIAIALVVEARRRPRLTVVHGGKESARADG